MKTLTAARLALPLLAVLLGSGCSRNDAHSPTFPDQLANGKDVYEMACAQCHYDGAGSSAAPDLKGSAVLTEPPKVLARLILKGQSGVSVVNGQPFKGTMPAQAYLTDAEIAAVTAYVRETFAGKSDPIAPADVASLRNE